ncbi:OmpH family outer membrane protein [Polaribacter uvawellassae]|uniref:OmpH family outer membrane protein n=1 Tax=Polaribacter uvawellassae TaxID=3133495 RepID=UPI0032194633
MKTKITLIIATFFVCLTITAQTKVGTVDREFIIAKMPQLKTVQDRISKYGARLDSINKSKITKHDASVKEFNDNIKTLSEADKKIKFTEISKLKQEITQFQQNGTTMMQLRRNDFMRPLYQKVNEVIEGIAKEKGYTQILTVSGNNFAYLDINHDITKLVLAKLGIKE